MCFLWLCSTPTCMHSLAHIERKQTDHYRQHLFPFCQLWWKCVRRLTRVNNMFALQYHKHKNPLFICPSTWQTHKFSPDKSLGIRPALDQHWPQNHNHNLGPIQWGQHERVYKQQKCKQGWQWWITVSLSVRNRCNFLAHAHHRHFEPSHCSVLPIWRQRPVILVWPLIQTYHLMLK